MGWIASLPANPSRAAGTGKQRPPARQFNLLDCSGASDGPMHSGPMHSRPGRLLLHPEVSLGALKQALRARTPHLIGRTGPSPWHFRVQGAFQHRASRASPPCSDGSTNHKCDCRALTCVNRQPPNGFFESRYGAVSAINLPETTTMANPRGEFPNKETRPLCCSPSPFGFLRSSSSRRHRRRYSQCPTWPDRPPRRSYLK